MFSKRSRRVIGAAAAVAATFGLAACGASGGGETTADGRVEVTFWQQKFEDYQQEWFKKNVDAFNASQDEVTVKLQVVPADTWEQKLQAAQAAGKQPDISTLSYGRIKPGVAEGKFAPLDEYLPTEAFSDIKENVSPFVTVDGKHYAYPMLVEPSTVLYYRSDLAEAAGLDPNSPPESWDELIEWSRALTQGDVKGMTVASTAADLGWASWGLQYNACGHLPISDDWSEARATEPCFAELAEFYKTLYQEGLMPQTPKVGYADGMPYGEGEVAMMQGGSWVVGQLKNDFPDVVDTTMVAPFPSIDGDPTKTTASLGGWTLGLDSKSKNPEAAAKFIEYLLAGDPEIMADFFTETGYSKYTVRTSVDEALANDPEASADPFMAVISEKIVPYGQAEPAYPWDVALAMGTAIESSMKGSADIETSLKTADDAINDIIEKQKLSGTATN
ncbi:ABC transporter substrate-binding protein [Antribacter gilvus]|uniref:ABC transporter substrate-binding protein n=1 Tax=Antribacter gilvus TaxID=2304675 RepID=UPI000F7A38B4|nr:extracellular solute-binding protein [Antribacter gilvus]